MATVRIPLSQDKVALIDEEDAERVSQFSWCAIRNQGSFYALRHKWIDGKKRHIYLHRFILGNVPKGHVVRHLNRNRLDNRRANLATVPKGGHGHHFSVKPDRLPIAMGDGTSTIKLTQGMTTVIDTADEHLVRHLVWHASRSHTGFYARCALRGPGSGIQLHRLLLDAPAHLQIDHINGDKLDNRRCNLRLCTASENMLHWSRMRRGRSE